MSLTERMLDWRDPRHYDDPPTDEEALRQFVYVAITDYIQENDRELAAWLEGDKDEPPSLSPWVDAYAERPLTEPDGYGRRDYPKTWTAASSAELAKDSEVA